MGYTIGVSSGLFIQSAEDKSEYVGLPRKSMFSMFKGVTFTQLDLQSLSEFQEPELDHKMKEVRDKMGIQYGLHGEVPEYSDAYPKLDCGIAEEWKRSHERFIAEIKGSINIKSKYLLFHASTSDPFIMLWRDLQTFRLCDIWGRLFEDFFKENPALVDWAIQKEFITSIVNRRGYLNIENAMEKANRELIKEQQDKGKKDEELKRPSDAEMETRAKEIMRDELIDALKKEDFTYGTERVAYYIIAKWMQDSKSCPAELHKLWTDIAGNGSLDDDKFREKSENWVPAVTAAYHWGHFYPEKCKKPTGAEDPKPLLTKGNMQLVFETPMAGKGGEETVRLARASHIYFMVKAINHPLVGVAVDAEHMLSANISPMEDVGRMPFNAGEKVFVMHVGYPAPLAPAHLPIPVGSDAQVYVYKLLWELRKKGMKNAIIIFERGGGQEPVKDSVISLRKIVMYLEKDTPPDKLPEDFFGLQEGGAAVTRQLIQTREHALDPLKGLLSVPEEEYGFLSTAASAKGKIEEWSKRKLK